MQKIISSLFVILMVAMVSFAIPNQVHAAWWNPLSWFTKERPAEEQKSSTTEVKNNTAQESQTTEVVETEPTETKPDTAPVAVPQSNPGDAKTIEDLKAEVAALKTSLDSLYDWSKTMSNNYNTLLEYTKSIATNKTAGAPVINSTLDTRVSDLEKKLNDVCAQTFSSIGSLSSNKCPSSQLQIKESLESRIKKLEGGY